MSKLTFQLFSRKRLFRPRQYYWRLRAANGEIIAQSEGYNRILDCRKTIELIRAHADNATVEDQI